jgi:hypothetical protein
MTPQETITEIAAMPPMRTNNLPDGRMDGHGATPFDFPN